MSFGTEAAGSFRSHAFVDIERVFANLPPVVESVDGLALLCRLHLAANLLVAVQQQLRKALCLGLVRLLFGESLVELLRNLLHQLFRHFAHLQRHLCGHLLLHYALQVFFRDHVLGSLFLRLAQSAPFHLLRRRRSAFSGRFSQIHRCFIRRWRVVLESRRFLTASGEDRCFLLRRRYVAHFNRSRGLLRRSFFDFTGTTSTHRFLGQHLVQNLTKNREVFAFPI
mmetsp:Transcript_17054/g.42292  ORF Transcript_17054/g.42292 Transcript_17054/m.42292 type:complete len:225 (-) Transcript_17054:3994-4668(-)